MSDIEQKTESAARTFQERVINTSDVIWQSLAAVIDGQDDDEAKERLEALDVDQLRLFHFQLDRIRTLTYNVRYFKMKRIDEAAKQEHEAEVKREESES